MDITSLTSCLWETMEVLQSITVKQVIPQETDEYLFCYYNVCFIFDQGITKLSLP